MPFLSEEESRENEGQAGERKIEMDTRSSLSIKRRREEKPFTSETHNAHKIAVLQTHGRILSPLLSFRLVERRRGNAVNCSASLSP